MNDTLFSRQESPYSAKIKICGLSRLCDIAYVNEARPDFCGFILDVPKSRRNISFSQLSALRERLDDSIVPVGVFVNAAADTILPLVKNGTIRAVQLHGSESPNFIRHLKEALDVPIIKAFPVTNAERLREAEQSPADLILLDHGAGGTGQCFDWSLAAAVRRPYLLAGGLGPGNVNAAITALTPWGVDMSSGVETDGKKDREKILAAVAAVRRNDT